MDSIIKIVFWILFIPVFVFLFYEIILFALAFFFDKKSAQSERKRKFLILIPAYREGDILIYSIEALEKINYPKHLFDVVLINDECDDRVIPKLRNKIKVLDVLLSSHSKAESLKEAIELANGYNFVVILDADNIVHPDFLVELNNSITESTKVIQGLRLPKNLNSTFEKIDAITDYVYNQLDRLIPSKLDLSGTLSGSGFAIETNLFRDLIPLIKTKGGFDKVLQSQLLLRKIPVEICSEAIIYDEKTGSSKSYLKQRTRWLYYHFYNSIKYGLKLLFKGILNFNFNQIHIGLISLRPPLNFIYLISLILIIVGYWTCLICTVVLLILLMIITLILLKNLKENKILSAKLILSLPLILINQIFSLTRFREAKTDSLKTEHHQSKSIEEILQNQKSKIKDE
ncbi:MAG: glycosyltransferase family 2 protein [Ignavibacteria bacterium]|jgi:cellulose synthase/poly-beta-1,6-N-acetylglucosamine synthase-like glycosyltransferase|nr:glycosyltransferase family 2 protein [Ignavibacteria bacterium]MDH7526902.1 glycosyltransferase family 2 protein [Ignavibacteria bacterium]